MSAPVSVADLPTSGGDRWYVELVLRATGPGGLILPAGRSELLAVLDIAPEAVAQMGGPGALRRAVEPTRRKLQEGAWRAGYRDGWAVEADVRRGRQRRVWSVNAELPALVLPVPGSEG